MNRQKKRIPDWPLDEEVAGRMIRLWHSFFAREHGVVRKKVCSRPSLGLLAWGRRYLPDHFRLPPSLLHRWLAEQADMVQTARGVKINVLGPRGGAKSTIGTLALPLRAAVEGREPYIWIISDTKHQACAHLENLKVELLENERLAADYPGGVGRGPVWRGNSIVLSNGATIEAFGTGQRLRGRRRRANRPTLIICDDLQNDGHTNSVVQREHSRAWFHGTLMKAGTAHTNIVNLATALHREAMAMELHRTPGWTSRIFKSIVHWPDNMSLWEQWESIYTDLTKTNYQQAARKYYETNEAAMKAGAVVLWPEVEDLYTLMCMRIEGGRTAFEREKQNSPINPDQCEWPESYFDDAIWFEDWPRTLIVKTMALDPSKGADSRRGDYSAIVLFGVDRQGILYVEADLARRPTPQIVSDATDRFCRFQPDVFGIETNQFQALFIGEFESEFRRRGVLGPRPTPIENHTAKQVRVRRLGPYLSSHRLRFKANCPSTRLLVEQLSEFPIGDHDDGPDALEMALRLAAGVLQGRSLNDGLGNRLPVGE